MDNVSFEAKKCVRNTVHSNLKNQISKTLPSVTTIGAPYTDLANSKETQIMRKNSCKQKYLDKNLDVWFLRHGV